MAGSLFVEVVTPEASLYSGPATALVARSRDGDFTVMAQHMAMAGDIVAGVIKVETDDGVRPFVVHGGYFNVGPDDDGGTRATVLAGVAEPVGTLDVARALAAKEAAEAVLAQRGDEVDERTADAARQSLARAALRLSAAGQ